MKSLYITVLATLCLLANRTLAHQNIEDMDLEEILDTFQDPNNFFINENNTTVDNSNTNVVKPTNNTIPETVAQTNNTIPETVTQTNNTIPETVTHTNQETVAQDENINIVVPQPEQIPVEQPLPEYDDNATNTNAKVCVLGGVGFTSVALIAFYGYKNKKRTVEIEEVTRELLFENNEENVNDISMPKKLRNSNSVNRLSRSISLSFSSMSDMFDDEKPLISNSIYSEKYSLAKNRAYKCHFEWSPLNSDEIILRRGDLVCVKESYDDGYSLGRNLYTRYDGIFPTCCLTTPEEKFMGSELIKEGEFQSILKRTSSKKTKRNRRSSTVSNVIPTWI